MRQPGVFVNESSKVVILDSNQEALDNAQSQLSPLTGGVCADVSSPDEIEAAFKEVDEIMGGIDILISNAGISVRQPFMKIDYDQWFESAAHQFRRNVFVRQSGH